MGKSGTEKCILLKSRGSFEDYECSRNYMAVCEGIMVSKELYPDNFIFL